MKAAILGIIFMCKSDKSLNPEIHQDQNPKPKSKGLSFLTRIVIAVGLIVAFNYALLYGMVYVIEQIYESESRDTADALSGINLINGAQTYPQFKGAMAKVKQDLVSGRVGDSGLANGVLIQYLTFSDKWILSHPNVTNSHIWEERDSLLRMSLRRLEGAELLYFMELLSDYLIREHNQLTAESMRELHEKSMKKKGLTREFNPYPMMTMTESEEEAIRECYSTLKEHFDRDSVWYVFRHFIHETNLPLGTPDCRLDENISPPQLKINLG